jgi:hypothetical protein
VRPRRGAVTRSAVALEQPEDDLARARGVAGLRIVAEAHRLVHGRGVRRSALDDGSLEEPARARRDQEREDVPAAGRLTEDRHSFRIPSEGCDVAPDPFEGAHQIEGAEVPRAVLGSRAFDRQRGMGEPAEDAEAVVDGHHDEPVLYREPASVVDPGAADGVAAPVDPEHDRKPFTLSGESFGIATRRVDI